MNFYYYLFSHLAKFLKKRKARDPELHAANLFSSLWLIIFFRILIVLSIKFDWHIPKYSDSPVVYFVVLVAVFILNLTLLVWYPPRYRFKPHYRILVWLVLAFVLIALLSPNLLT